MDTLALTIGKADCTAGEKYLDELLNTSRTKKNAEKRKRLSVRRRLTLKEHNAKKV